MRPIMADTADVFTMRGALSDELTPVVIHGAETSSGMSCPTAAIILARGIVSHERTRTHTDSGFRCTRLLPLGYPRSWAACASRTAASF